MSQLHGTATGNAAKAPGARLPLTAARIAALAVGVPACLVMVGGAGFSLVESIGKGTVPVSYAFPAGAREARVTVDGGNLVLRQASGNGGSIVGTGSYSLIRPRITEGYSRGAVSFGYRCRAPGGNCALNAAVKVPAASAISVFTDGGNVTAYGTTGPADLVTGGGNVTASQTAGDLTLNTDGGDIHATGIASTEVTASTGGGDIEIVFTRAPRNVHVTTDGGDVTIVVPRGSTRYAVTAGVPDGDIVNDSTISTNASSPNKIYATTGGGNITIRQAAT